MKKQTLVQRALALLQGGDEAKLSRFETRLGKYFIEQKGIRNREIEALNEKLVDLREDFEETIPNIDVEAIAKTEGITAYLPTYVGVLNAKLKAIDAVEAQIVALQDEIAKLDRLEDAIYGKEEAVVA